MAVDLNRRIDGIVFPNLVTSFLNHAQQLILTELGVVKQKRAKILLHEPNYVQLRAWGKTRVCLALCFLDMHKNQQNGARYLVITDSNFDSEHWVQEWNAFSRWCGGTLNARASLTACKTFDDIITWPRQQSVDVNKAQFIIVSRSLISSDRVADILRNTIWTMCLLDATMPNSFSLRTCCFIIVKHFRRDQNYHQHAGSTDQVVPSLPSTTRNQVATLQLQSQQYQYIEDGLWEFVNNIVAATRPIEQTTGLGLEKSLPDYFQYDPTPHLLVLLGRNVVHNTVNEIRKLVPPYGQRFEFSQVARNLHIQTNMPLGYRHENREKQCAADADNKEVEKKSNTFDEKEKGHNTDNDVNNKRKLSQDDNDENDDNKRKLSQDADNNKDAFSPECSVCCEKITFASQIVTLQCCSAPCICSSCFYKHFFLSLAKGPTIKCIFCTKKIKYVLPGERSHSPGPRQPVSLHRQLTALRLLYELREKICETNFNFLILIHKDIVQKYFANLKRFSQTMNAFSAESLFYLRAGDSEIPIVAIRSNLVFVYDKPDDIFDFFVDKKLLTIGLVAHVRTLQDTNPVDDGFFERLCATRIRNARLIISKFFIE